MKIDKYGNDENISLDDKLTGTDFDDAKKTKNYSFRSIIAFLKLQGLSGNVTTYSLSYKVYTASLSQTGTAAPVISSFNNLPLQNTFSDAIVWTRASSGLFNGTLPGAFTATKTVIFITQGSGSSRLAAHSPDANTVQVISMNAYLNEFADNSITKANIEIRVYN
jgi:hypothetical protein